METEGILSVSEAAAALSAARTEQPKDENTETRAVETQTETPPATESAPEAGADAAPAETQPSGENEATEPAVPPIDPPPFWSAEEKATFQKLPPEAQRVILEREKERDTAIRRQQNELAEQRKALDAEAARLKVAPPPPQVALMWAELARDFPEVKSAEDLANLARTDVARASEFKIRYDAAVAAQNQINELQTNQLRMQYVEHIQKAEQALIEKFPHWKDQAVGKKEIAEIHDYLRSQGVPDTEIKGDPARFIPGMTNPVYYDVARKAMLYDRAQAAKKAAEAKVKALPPVIKPGANPPSKAQAKAAEIAEISNRLDKTGSIHDAVALLRASRK